MKKEIDRGMENEIVDSAEQIGAGLVGIIVVFVLIVAAIVGISILLATHG